MSRTEKARRIYTQAEETNRPDGSSIDSLAVMPLRALPHMICRTGLLWPPLHAADCPPPSAMPYLISHARPPLDRPITAKTSVCLLHLHILRHPPNTLPVAYNHPIELAAPSLPTAPPPNHHKTKSPQKRTPKKNPTHPASSPHYT